MKLGIYQHFKGMKYKVLGLVKHSETLEEMVLYEALYDNELSKLWVRPKDMFFEEVVVQGKKVPRFTYVGNI
jgi:hypothetical protein